MNKIKIKKKKKQTSHFSDGETEAQGVYFAVTSLGSQMGLHCKYSTSTCEEIFSESCV
jgi:hypothetical protein